MPFAQKGQKSNQIGGKLNSDGTFPAGAEKIAIVFNFAKVTNPDIDFGDSFDVLDLGVDSQGREIAGQVLAYPWGNSAVRIDDRYLSSLSTAGIVRLLNTVIHEGLHRNQSFLDQTLREPTTHPQVYKEANHRTSLLQQSFEGHIRSVYQ